MSDRQFKALPYFPIKAASEGRVRKGICAVFGNVDSWGDRIMPGAFAKTISENFGRVKHLYNHNFGDIPTAVVKELKEVGRDDLPPGVLEYAPEATGGLMVARDYLTNTQANDVLEALDKGAITEMSFGYDVLKSAESEENEVKIRNLVELKLFDTSDVLWGMNAATVAAGAKSALPIGVIVQHLNTFTAEIKAGRRNAGTDESLINAIHRAALDLGCTECAGIKDDDEKAEAVFIDTSLSAQRLEFARLKTNILRGAYENQISSA